MPNIDIRLHISTPGSVEVRKLNKMIHNGWWHLTMLWVAVATSKNPDGVLTGWDEDSISVASQFHGKSISLISAFKSCGWIRNIDGTYHLHESWAEEQRWVLQAPARAASASRASRIKWKKRRSGKSAGSNAGSNAPTVPSVPTVPQVLPNQPTSNLVPGSTVDRLNKYRDPEKSSSSSSPKPPSSPGPPGPRDDDDDDDDSALPVTAGTLELYRKTFGQLPAPAVRGKLARAEALYPGDWLRKAFRLASLHNGRSWAYVQAILEEFEEKRGRDSPDPSPSPSPGDPMESAAQGRLTTAEWIHDARLRAAALAAGHRPREDQVHAIRGSSLSAARKALAEIEEYNT